MSVPPYQDPAYQDPVTPPYGTAAGTNYPEYPPYLPPMPYPYAPGPYPPYLAPQPPPRTNGFAIAALVCAFLFAPLGIVFGHISLSQIKSSREEGRGMAVAGLVIGYIVTIGTILALIAGALLISWAAKVVRENPQFHGAMASGQLPAFAAPAGLGMDCQYPPTVTPAVRPVVPPPAGAAPAQPAVATMVTNDGPVRLDLDGTKAPCTVNSFLTLAQQGYFDKTDCHRLTDSATMAVLQCGDPTGTGSGGPGYRFANEYPTNQYRPLDRALAKPVTYPRGTLAMANSGPNSNGSQFFIVYRDSALPPTYTVFGRVDEKSLEIVDALVSGGVTDGAEDGTPRQPVTVTSIRP